MAGMNLRRVRRLERKAGVTGRCEACGHKPQEWPCYIIDNLDRPLPPQMVWCAACRPCVKVLRLPADLFAQEEFTATFPDGRRVRRLPGQE